MSYGTPHPALRRRAPAALAALLPLLALGVAGAGGAAAASTTGTALHAVPTAGNPVQINFQPAKAPVPAGYVADTGAPFNGTSGWVDATGAPLDLTANTRDRNAAASPDQRYDTMVLVQAPSGSGTTTPGTYRYALPNGQYDVHVVAGDATAFNSVYQVNAESGTASATTLINHVVPSSSAPYADATGRVTVSDGFLDLDAAGGSNTKLDFLQISAVPGPDTTAPSVTVALSGPSTSPGTYVGDVTYTVTATDDTGVTGTSVSLDGAPPQPYAGPVTVTADGSHTVTATATDAAGNAGSGSASWTESHPAGSPALQVSSPDDPLLGSARPRLLFSTNRSVATPARSVTVTDTGTAPLVVSGLSLSGSDAGSYQLAPGQPTSFVVSPGSSAAVSLVFTPRAASGCPTSSNPNAVADVERYATLTVSSNDATSAPSTVDLAGLNACDVEGSNEPTLSQMTRALGYTTKVTNSTTDVRFLGPARSLSASDEVQAPYFVRLDASQPVTLTPVAHYGGRTVTSTTYAGTGWYAKGAPVKTPCTASAGCTRLFGFPGDAAKPGPYAENQKLLPVPSGVTTFSPSGPFGLYTGDGYGINFTDDGKNAAVTSSNAAITPPHYLHDIRVYPALGPGRTPIPGTWLLANDITRVPSYKNNDYQDVLFVLRNAALDTPVSARPGSAGTSVDLTAGGTVSGSCVVTGFAGVLPNTAGTQCAPSNIAFGPSGLGLTSTAGQMGSTVNSQQDALYQTFDATRTAFTVTARVVGPVDYLSGNYQQVAAFFGPDQDNYVKVELEHNGSGTDPHVTMFFEEGAAGSTVQTLSLPAVTSASTVDLIIKGNTSVPDPTPAGSDPNSIRNYPLGQVTVFYSLDGAAPVQVGTVEAPADVTRWFSTSAKAGVLASGGGSSTPFTATFSRFGITAG